MKVCVMGIPGSGKTTLSAALAASLELPLITSHDLVMAIDPKAITEGRMANSDLMAEASKEVMSMPEWVFDGFPRAPKQASLVPSDAITIMLTVRRDIAVERQRNRGRSDDIDEIIERRLQEQSVLMAVDEKEGWAYRLAGYGRVLNTSYLSVGQVASQVTAYLRGERREVF